MSCTHPWTIINHLLSANETCSAVLDLQDFDFRLTLARYALLFSLTCAFESPFVYLQFRQRRWLLWLLLLNLATHPLVFGFLCRRLGFPLHRAVQGLLYGNLVTCVNSSLRLMAIGQTAGQAIIARLLPLVAHGWEIAKRLEPEEAYACTPLAELMAMRHETLYSRLFMS